ncbi:MAG: carboxypeptidase-like regulatory domain-containing protein, partial [Bacteroidota bacterium]
MMFYITNKFFIRSLFAVNILLLCSFSGFSQFRVKGKITDEKGESLVGVNVMVKNTSAGTLSGIDGGYSIEVADNQSVLVFSYVGYGSKEIGVNGMSEINVVLSESAELLDE